MSYRGVKRVLGETRLELKCLVLFAVCLLTLIGGSFWWYGSQTEKLVYDKARSTGHDLVTAGLLQRHWTILDKDSPTEATSLGRANCRRKLHCQFSKARQHESEQSAAG